MATITGTPGNDLITGQTTDADDIRGLEGNDTFNGGGGQDTLNGGPGDDWIGANAGAVVITGAGQDSVTGAFASFTIEDFTPGPGGDILGLSQGQRNVNFVSFPGFASGYASLTQQGSDTLLTVQPFPGSGMTSPAVITLRNVNAASLTADNIVSVSPFGQISIHFDSPLGPHTGTSGLDELVGAAANDILPGGDSPDTSFGNGGDDTHFGGGGDDVLVDSTGADRLEGGDGNDTLWGGDGTDSLLGGAGDDWLIGQGDDDAITGGAGKDTFFVGPGDGNTWIYDLNRSEGDGVVIGSNVGVTVFKPVGVDVVVATLTTGQIINLQGASLATLGNWLIERRGQPSDDLRQAGETMFGLDPGPETLTGAAGSDVIVDGDGSAVINGGFGNDTLWGGAGNDFLYGDDGQDRLIGQGGTNLMVGGTGGDQFVVTGADTSDWIVDFNKAAGDRVMLVTGVTFSMQQFDFGVGVALSTGQQIGLQGATVAGLGSDWFGYY